MVKLIFLMVYWEWARFPIFDVMGFVTVEVNDFNNSLLRLFKWVHTGYSVPSLYRSSPFVASLVGFFCEL